MGENAGEDLDTIVQKKNKKKQKTRIQNKRLGKENGQRTIQINKADGQEKG